MIKLVLGWPPSDLSPNKLHWTKLAAAKTIQKDCETVKRTIEKFKLTNLPEKLVLEMTFIPPDRRNYDRDNLVAE